MTKNKRKQNSFLNTLHTMKNSIPVLILAMILSLPIYSQTDPTPKAVFSSEQQTLTFYYDTLDYAADNVIPSTPPPNRLR